MTDYLLLFLYIASCVLWAAVALVAAGVLSIGLVYLGWLLLY